MIELDDKVLDMRMRDGPLPLRIQHLAYMITLRLPLILAANEHVRLAELAVNDISEASLTLFTNFKLKSSDFYLTECAENCFQVKLRLRGGKGGFGSQLRAQGNKMSSKKRAGNYESCRTLNGQRIRVQKQTKLIEEYLAKEPERLSKREQEIREKMQRYLEAPDKKVMFSDPDYLKLCRKLVDSTEDAVRSGLRTRAESDDGEDDEDSEEDEESEEDVNIIKDESIAKDQELTDDSEEELDEKAPVKNTNTNRIQSRYLDKYLKK